MAITAYGVAGTASVDASHWARSHNRLMDAVMGGAKMFVSGMTATISGANLSVATGEVYQPGVLSVSDATATVTAVPTTATNPRIAYLCLRTDYNGTSTGASTLVVVLGSPGLNPVAPSLTQNAGTLWFTPLYRYTVASGAAVASNLTDVRSGLVVAPERTCSGSVTLSDGGTDPSTLAVSFPAGLFTTAPRVLMSPTSAISSTVTQSWSAVNKSKDGFTARISKSNTGSTSFDWIASGY